MAEGLCETLDLVPIAAWHGSGRKAGWLSPFLLAVYNPETDEYEALCKVRLQRAGSSMPNVDRASMGAADFEPF